MKKMIWKFIFILLLMEAGLLRDGINVLAMRYITAPVVVQDPYGNPVLTQRVVLAPATPQPSYAGQYNRRSPFDFIHPQIYDSLRQKMQNLFKSTAGEGVPPTNRMNTNTKGESWEDEEGTPRGDIHSPHKTNHKSRRSQRKVKETRRQGKKKPTDFNDDYDEDNKDNYKTSQPPIDNLKPIVPELLDLVKFEPITPSGTMNPEQLPLQSFQTNPNGELGAGNVNPLGNLRNEGQLPKQNLMASDLANPMLPKNAPGALSGFPPSDSLGSLPQPTQVTLGGFQQPQELNYNQPPILMDHNSNFGTDTLNQSGKRKKINPPLIPSSVPNSDSQTIGRMPNENLFGNPIPKSNAIYPSLAIRGPEQSNNLLSTQYPNFNSPEFPTTDNSDSNGLLKPKNQNGLGKLPSLNTAVTDLMKNDQQLQPPLGLMATGDLRL